jgi:hypothetical protein
MTSTQASVLAYMKEFFAANDQLPPMEYLKRRFNWNSNRKVLVCYDALSAKGLIEKNVTGKYRFTRGAV